MGIKGKKIMICKRKIVKVVRTDLKTGKKDCLTECGCEIVDGNQLLYTESAPSLCPVRVNIGEDRVVIKRQGEASTVMYLVLHQRSFSQVSTEMGTFEIENRLTRLEKHENLWRIEYQSGDLNGDYEFYRMEWYFKEALA